MFAIGRFHRYYYALVLILVHCNLWTHVASQEAYSVEDLKSMASEELEQICIVRGFQIMHDEIDPTTGLPYELTHDDFVEAAQRCLDIEKEMNELLEEYPELAAEVEEEIRKLEAEQEIRKSEVEQLQEDLQKAEEAADTASSEDSGAAFVSSSEHVAAQGEEKSMDDFEIVDDSDSVQTTDYFMKGSTMENDISVGEVASEEQQEDTEIMAKNETRAEEDFTLKALTYEVIRGVIKQLEGDIKRIAELMAPVIQPILRAGDVAWRHVRVTLESLRKSYENSRGTNGRESSSNGDQATSQ